MVKIYQVFFTDKANECKCESFIECRKATSFARSKSKNGSTVSVYQSDGMGTSILRSVYFNGKKTF